MALRAAFDGSEVLLELFVVVLSLGLTLWFWALPAVSEATVAPVVVLVGIALVVVAAVALLRSGSITSRKRPKAE